MIRRDLLAIAEMIDPGTRVLDIGCDDGSLLDYLARTKQVDGRGIELSQAGVNGCVARGLSVIQGDADTDLADYPAGSFDYAILSQTLQATRAPRTVLSHLARIGRRVIVSFPNFGHWRVRWALMAGGHMPNTPDLPYAWYDTPNIHLCTVQDFKTLAADLDLTIERMRALTSAGDPIPAWAARFPNLLAPQVVCLLRGR